MTWFKVDDSFDFHPKAVAAGNAALGLWVRAGAYASRQLTEGFVPTGMLAALGAKPKDAGALVKAGLWVSVEGGYRFHQWEQANPTKAAVLADRQAAAARQRRAREKAAEKKAAEEESRAPSRRDSRVQSRVKSRRDENPECGNEMVSTDEKRGHGTVTALQETAHLRSVDNPLTSQDDEMSRRDSQDRHGPPDPTRPVLKNKPIQDLVCRRLFGDARPNLTDDDRADLWQLWAEAAGPQVDLDAELLAWLLHNTATDLHNPSAALLGWLRTGAKRSTQSAVSGCDRCIRGWVADEYGQPSEHRCTACRPHLRAMESS